MTYSNFNDTDTITIAEDIDADNLLIQSEKNIKIDLREHSIKANKVRVEAGENLSIEGNGLIPDATDAKIRKAISDVPSMLALYEHLKQYGPTVHTVEQLSYNVLERIGGQKSITISDTIVYATPEVSLQDCIITAATSIIFRGVHDMDCDGSHIKSPVIIFEDSTVSKSDLAFCHLHTQQIVGLISE